MNELQQTILALVELAQRGLVSRGNLGTLVVELADWLDGHPRNLSRSRAGALVLESMELFRQSVEQLEEHLLDPEGRHLELAALLAYEAQDVAEAAMHAQAEMPCLRVA